ncbi:MAG: hypothetical protein HC825_06710 [Oscillatoriales cyanobacterium RM1_1_9]|nr:hypothetical protein [Oscillatoriales cyanobacterium SM2_3_0]NJO71454.1 hypothetical protein [Oscillatoriales cyanobacterium RM1_1_9]
MEVSTKFVMGLESASESRCSWPWGIENACRDWLAGAGVTQSSQLALKQESLCT